MWTESMHSLFMHEDKNIKRDIEDEANGVCVFIVFGNRQPQLTWLPCITETYTPSHSKQ